jgi:hypothetical protein
MQGGISLKDGVLKKFNSIKIFQKMNPITWIILFNLSLRLILYFSSLVGEKKNNKLKKPNVARHMRETFGIALVATSILAYITFYFPEAKSFKMRDSILLLLYFTMLVYDYIIGFSNLIPKKYFTQTKKKQAQLGAIYFAMILGSVAFFLVLVQALYLLQSELLPDHYNMFSNPFSYMPLIIAGGMFASIFIIAILTFFLINVDLEDKKKTYSGDNKTFYNDMFRMFYILFTLAFVLLILYIANNIDMIPF